MEIDNRLIEALEQVIIDSVDRRPFGLLLYGSRVAGYSREDSDYDVICILENFDNKLRYLYTSSQGYYFSILLVDKSIFEDDAYTAKYGEFIIGRLLSIFIPVYNSKYIEEIEIKYKERVIEEELAFLFKKYGRLILDMKIPVKYVLFSRLNKRIKAYPPVKYSYLKTYYGINGSRNLKWAVNRFIRAAKKLMDKNLLEVDDEKFRVKHMLKGIEIDTYILWLRSIKAYLTHGRSAKVSPKVVGEEVKSKIIRSIDTLRSPKELDEPDILLELNNSYFTPKRHTVSELIKVIYGKDSKIRGTIKRGLLSPLYIIKVDREDLSKAIVIKAFNILWIFKWLMIQLWLIDIKRFTLDSRNRLVNEYLGLIWLRNKLGVNAPKPLLLDWGSGRLVMEYIDGKPLSRYINEDLTISKKYFYQYGRILAGIHNRGYTLGDTKVQNILISNDEIYLIDIEQWSTKPHYAWDISLFIFYTLKFRFRDEGLSELIMRFIDGYIDGGGNPENIRKAVSLRLIRAFMPLVPIHILYKIRRLVTQQF